MASVDMCEHDWPGSGCPDCKALAKPAPEPAGGVREVLRIARDYVVDARNERQEELIRVGAYPGLVKREEARLDAIEKDLREIDAALSSSAAPADPVAWRGRERPGFPWELLSGDPTRRPKYRGDEIQPLYAHPAPATVEMREQGFVAGYEAALRDVGVFRIKISDPFDSAFVTHKGFVFDMLKRNADKLRATLSATEGRKS